MQEMNGHLGACRLKACLVSSIIWPIARATDYVGKVVKDMPISKSFKVSRHGSEAQINLGPDSCNCEQDSGMRAGTDTQAVYTQVSFSCQNSRLSKGMSESSLYER